MGFGAHHLRSGIPSVFTGTPRHEYLLRWQPVRCLLVAVRTLGINFLHDPLTAVQRGILLRCHVAKSSPMGTSRSSQWARNICKQAHSANAYYAGLHRRCFAEAFFRARLKTPRSGV